VCLAAALILVTYQGIDLWAAAQQFLAQLLDEHHRLDRGGRPRRTYTEALERFTYDYLPTLKP
jgi:hypothetical protein